MKYLPTYNKSTIIHQFDGPHDIVLLSSTYNIELNQYLLISEQLQVRRRNAFSIKRTHNT